ncbi:DNA cytosine methyltransferase [Mesorhizobium sp. WSM4307]|nr:DNA cytosine methyltransferase [Mesorhizobium sp. WSM4315]TRC80179.1 DNA cytosine methyltransferase [Mesorhizobium sp. WSM4307]
MPFEPWGPHLARKAVDLFSGSGGVTAGLKSAGWAVVAAVDIDPVAASTYRANHPEVAFFEADLAKRSTIDALKKQVGSEVIDLLVVCAPCQPFSSQNRKRGSDPVRETLILKSLAAVRALKPKLVLFENVPGLVGPDYQDIIQRLFRLLGRAGYTVSGPNVEDASFYGVPQRRRRCIVVAAKDPNCLKRFDDAKPRSTKRTVQDAIADLRTLASGERDPDDILHFARKHSDIAIARLEAISHDGGSRAELPNHLVLKCHRQQTGFPDVYGRMKWRDVAPTLTTGCTDITRGRFAHPSQNRAITLREAARLQSFGDQYIFSGTARQIAIQIGNAVPPAMIRSFATAFEVALG